MEILSLIRINKTIYDKMKKKTLSYGEYEAVTNGLLRIVRNEGITLPEKATNGDVIKALFPDVSMALEEKIDREAWWNSQYRGIDDKRGEI